MQSLKNAELSINIQSMNIKNVVKLELNKMYRSLIKLDSSVYSLLIRQNNMQKSFPIQNILMNTNN